MSRLQYAINALLGPACSLEQAMQSCFTEDFRQRREGRWLSRQEFAAQIQSLRELAQAIRVTVLDEIVDAPRYAHRHVIEVTLHDGGILQREVYVFAELAPDGRFRRIEEVSMDLGPTAAGP